jgi:aarF domain-containing kinase
VISKFSSNFYVHNSKSVLGTQMSKEERNHLRDELKYLTFEDITAFMDSLPPDFLVILRTE